ncbi:MAG: glycoside hydrolase family 3 N-terminal domain-containing protein, partial [Erysipelotrichaceae bacterium]
KEPSQRVKDILAKMTTKEKAAQLSCVMPSLLLNKGVFDKTRADEAMPDGVGRMTQFASGFTDPVQAAEGYNAIQKDIISKCGLPAIIQNESSSGTVAAEGTIFPVPVALAATFEDELAYKMGKVIGDEGKAIGVHAMMSPVADINRDSRWGRVDETFGEDPFLAARFTSEEVRGIQGDDYTKRCAALAKHFVGYGASEGGINCATINIGKKELFEVYATPFAAAIKENNMQQVMVTYSEIDGRPMSVNDEYTQKLLREDLGFNGIAVCDGMSIPRVIETQGMYESRAELAGKALRAGIDADTMFTTVYNHIEEGVEKGLVDMKDLDAAVLRTLAFREEMGLLDNPYVDVSKVREIYDDPKSDELSAEIAQKSITLLKNNGILPLKNKKQKIAIVGPFATKLAGFFGGYAYPAMMGSFLEMIVDPSVSVNMEGFQEIAEKMFDVPTMKAKMYKDPTKPFSENFDDYLRESLGTKSMYEAIKEEFAESEIVAIGKSLNTPEYETIISESLDLCKDADIVIMALGEITGQGKDATSGEGINHPDLSLPFHQEELVKEVKKLNKPMILTLFNGRPMALGEVEPLFDAIVECWYPGPAGAMPVVKVLSGAYNPEGRLPVTFPQISAQCPIYYGTKTGSGYMNIKQEPEKSVMQPLYPFGYGLSYSDFKIDNYRCDESVETGKSFKLSFDVTNISDRKGKETVQIYTHSICPTVNRPIKELRGYVKVDLNPGETKTLEFELDTRNFGYLNADNEFVIENRAQEVFVCTDSSTIVHKSRIEFTGKTKEILHDRVFNFRVKVSSAGLSDEELEDVSGGSIMELRNKPAIML